MFWSSSVGANARRRMSSRKACGVSALRSVARATVPLIIGPSIFLIVSVTSATRHAAPAWSATRIVRSISSTVTSGRAPSWTATTSHDGSTFSRPFLTDSARVEPPATSLFSLPNERSTRACSKCSRPDSLKTSMISSTAAHSSNFSSVWIMTGLPASEANCFGMSLPKREPVPAATMMAVFSCRSPQ